MDPEACEAEPDAGIEAKGADDVLVSDTPETETDTTETDAEGRLPEVTEPLTETEIDKDLLPLPILPADCEMTTPDVKDAERLSEAETKTTLADACDVLLGEPAETETGTEELPLARLTLPGLLTDTGGAEPDTDTNTLPDNDDALADTCDTLARLSEANEGDRLPETEKGKLTDVTTDPRALGDTATLPSETEGRLPLTGSDADKEADKEKDRDPLTKEGNSDADCDTLTMKLPDSDPWLRDTAGKSIQQ